MSKPNPTKAGRLPLNGAQFYYKAAGQGDPLLLVHAGIADHRMWEAQFPAFAEHFQTICYDMRGFGETPPAAGAFSHWQDLHSLVRALEIPTAHFVGCSLGGAIILDLALQHPSLVRSLTLVGCPPSGFPVFAQRPRQWDELEQAFDRGDFARAAELEVEIWVDGPQRGPQEVDPAVRRRVRDMNQIALANEALEIGEEQSLEPPAIQRLSEVAVPTLVIAGDLDVATIRQASDLLAANIAGAQKVTIPNTAHLPNMEQPQMFNQIVLDFLLEQQK